MYNHALLVSLAVATTRAEKPLTWKSSIELDSKEPKSQDWVTIFTGEFEDVKVTLNRDRRTLVYTNLKARDAYSLDYSLASGDDLNDWQKLRAEITSQVTKRFGASLGV
jgi:hypothetical protein